MVRYRFKCDDSINPYIWGRTLSFFGRGDDIELFLNEVLPPPPPKKHKIVLFFWLVGEEHDIQAMVFW